MVDYDKRLLNFPNLLDNNLAKLIDCIVNYYGENRRKEIEEKFSKIMFIGYLSPDTKKNILTRIKNETTSNLEDKYLKQLGVSLKKEEVFEDSSFEYENIITMKYYSDFLSKFMMGRETRLNDFIETGTNAIKEIIPEFTKEELLEMMKNKTLLEKYESLPFWLKDNILFYIDENNANKVLKDLFDKSLPLLQKIKPEITYDNYKELFNDPKIRELNMIALIYPKIIEEYKESIKDILPYEEESKKIEDIRLSLNEKYYKRFVLNHIEWIPEKDRVHIKEYLESNQNSYLIKDYIKKIFGLSLDSSFLLETFKKETDDILKDEKQSSWKKENILENRQKFKELFGDINPPTYEEIEAMEEDRNQLINKRNIEFFDSIPDNKTIREKIDKMNLLDGEDSFDATLYAGKACTKVNPNIIKTDNGYDDCTLVYVDGKDASRIDHDLIHELNHVLELSIKDVSDSRYTMICGWDEVGGSLKGTKKPIDTINIEEKQRDYELFNEIINEMITQEICSKMSNDNIHILDDESLSEYRFHTSYETAFVLIYDFFQEFKKEIIESRANGNIKIILDEVGEENFNSLNEMIKRFFDHFEKGRVVFVFKDINQGKVTKDTEYLKNMIIDAKKLVQKMKTYKMLHDEKEEEINENYQY